ncbi:MAG TPA: prepilin-type N-terminal cleavage/methylation domain-containing protein [Kiritimatiellia bacterium]|nr:prepilin-type N-terminal cleavage/methylation domain-containing protein [Kiritimatiellia bacterium]
MIQIRNDKASGKAGFTLIEVIAVLVILAVLAAVAIPRYLNLIDDARVQALEGAIAAAQSHLSLTYGRLALQTGVEPTAAEVAAEANLEPPNSAEYTFAFAATATPGVNITATEVATGVNDVREWLMP